MRLDNYEYIFSDFDGTISRDDVIHSFITSFTKGDSSIAEKKWCRGEITSKECYKLQFELINGLSEKRFNDFVNSIEIDPYFVDFYNFVSAKNKKIIIVSDGFDVFVNSALKKHNIKLPVFSNHLKVENKSGSLFFEVEYPNISENCEIGIGSCKCKTAKKYSNNFIYIGDGLSDRCISKKASLVFAKKSLEKCCARENIHCIHYENFQDIKNVLIKS